jgi:hypothetical protein
MMWSGLLNSRKVQTLPMLRRVPIAFVCFTLALGAFAGETVDLLAPRAARAESTRNRSPQELARNLYTEAQSLRQAGRLTAALGKLREAYAALPTPALLWPIAELCADLQQPLEGLEALKSYKQGMSPGEMEAGQGLADADKLEAKLRGQLVTVRTGPKSGAIGDLVEIDGREVGRLPLQSAVYLNPGAHKIRIAQGPVVDVQLHPGQDTLYPAEDAPTTATGKYFPHPLTWAAIGLTTATLAATTVVGSLALYRAGALTDQCPDRLCLGGTNQPIGPLSDAVRAEHSASIAAATLLGFSVAFLVGTSALIIVDWQKQLRGKTLLTRRNSRGLASIVPVAAPDAAGLVFGGRF